MKLLSSITGPAFIICALAVFSLAFAQSKPAPPVNPTLDDMKQHMELMAEAARPGPMNKLLADRAGDYDIKLQMWINADDRGAAPAMESTGQASLRPVLGGRFLMHDETAALAGENITSIKYWGYSRDAGRFEAVWSYTGSTTMMILTGTSADDGKTVRYTSDVIAAGGENEKYEITVKQLSPDSFSIDLVGLMENGAKGTALLSTYTRKK